MRGGLRERIYVKCWAFTDKYLIDESFCYWIGCLRYIIFIFYNKSYDNISIFKYIFLKCSFYIEKKFLVYRILKCYFYFEVINNNSVFVGMNMRVWLYILSNLL